MARGWESKSVEDQIDAAKDLRSAVPVKLLDPHVQERLRRKESLLLSRTRVLREFEDSVNPRYRDLKRKALAELDAQLAALEP